MLWVALTSSATVRGEIPDVVRTGPLPETVSDRRGFAGSTVAGRGFGAGSSFGGGCRAGSSDSSGIGLFENRSRPGDNLLVGEPGGVLLRLVDGDTVLPLDDSRSFRCCTCQGWARIR